MRYVTVCALGLLLCVSAYAGESPVLCLDEGVNEIALTVRNTGSDNISATIDPSVLPKWLSIGGSSTGMAAGSDIQLVVKLLVNGASGGEALVPFTISDGQGQTWTFKATLKTASSNPTETALLNNYPNPFNPTTTIRFSLKTDVTAKVVIYNSIGQKVRTLVNGPIEAGMHSVYWDGRNDHGMKSASGVYFCRLTAGGMHKTMKMVFAQ